MTEPEGRPGPYSSADVAAYAAALFPGEPPEAILDLLNQYGSEPHERERERVQLAILFLGQAGRDELAHFLARAKADYRDVLLWAEHDREGRRRIPYRW